MTLLDVLQRVRERTDSVIVAVSRGKDSVVALDLAHKHFARVEAFCMVLVPGISFVESYLGYLERRYAPLKIERVPHWQLAQMFRNALYRPLAYAMPRVTIRHIHAAQAKRTGIGWVLTGQKAQDSLMSRGMLSSLKAIDERADVKVGFPLAWWTDRQVYQYLRQNAIPLPGDYAVFGNRTWSHQLGARRLAILKEHYPEDYARIEAVFPFIGVSGAREKLRRGKEEGTRAAAGAGTDDAGTPAPAQVGAGQGAGADQPGSDHAG